MGGTLEAGAAGLQTMQVVVGVAFAALGSGEGTEAAHSLGVFAFCALAGAGVSGKRQSSLWSMRAVAASNGKASRQPPQVNRSECLWVPGGQS